MKTAYKIALAAAATVAGVVVYRKLKKRNCPAIPDTYPAPAFIPVVEVKAHSTETPGFDVENIPPVTSIIQSVYGHQIALLK